MKNCTWMLLENIQVRQITLPVLCKTLVWNMPPQREESRCKLGDPPIRKNKGHWLFNAKCTVTQGSWTRELQGGVTSLKSSHGSRRKDGVKKLGEHDMLFSISGIWIEAFQHQDLVYNVPGTWSRRKVFALVSQVGEKEHQSTVKKDKMQDILFTNNKNCTNSPQHKCFHTVDDKRLFICCGHSQRQWTEPWNLDMTGSDKKMTDQNAFGYKDPLQDEASGK